MYLNEELKKILGEKIVFSNQMDRSVYRTDIGHLVEGMPEVVVVPRTTEDVRKVVIFANEKGTPVTIRGGGTTWNGESVSNGGILMDMKGMNKVIEYNVKEKWVTAEAGMTWIKLYQYLKEHDLSFRSAPDNLVSTVGGSISTCGYGFHCTKYGSLADHVLGLEVVLPDGKVLQRGPKEIGMRMYGADPLPLFLSGYGTFGIITKATFRCYSYDERSPSHLVGLLYNKFEIEDAVEDMLLMSKNCNPDILYFGSTTPEFQMMYKDMLIEEAHKLGCTYKRKIPLMVQLYSAYLRKFGKKTPSRFNFVFAGYDGMDNKKKLRCVKSASRGNALYEFSVDDEYLVRGRALWRIFTQKGAIPCFSDCVVPASCAGEMIRFGITELEKNGFNQIALYGLLTQNKSAIGIGFYTGLPLDRVSEYEGVRKKIAEKVVKFGGVIYKYGGIRKNTAKESIGEGYNLMHLLKNKLDPNDILNRGVLF
ncbi:MAG: FAD-binding oxidoreductase [Candidatus Methanoperedens sp.]|nr:FAD-binding oxidoreductase [Candidatus Methanoperedens sp.]MCZ7384238.1 FAD-binding oxidoreductase [Candidatus Methanoperedens sp.]